MSALKPNILDALKFWINPKEYYKESPILLKKWAKKIYKKYNYTCARCGYKAEKIKGTWRSKRRIEAHHVLPKSKYPKLVYSVQNGVCLCEVCHRTGKDSYHSLNGNDGNKKMFNYWLETTTKTDKQKRNDLLNKVILITLAIASILVVVVILLLIFKG